MEPLPVLTLDSLFAQVFENLTGLQADIGTVIGAGIVLLFILIGLQKIKDALVVRETNYLLDRARSYNNLAKDMDDEESRSYLRLRARRALRRASEL